MVSFGILTTIAVLATISCTSGKPTLDRAELESLTRDMPTKKQIEDMKLKYPCRARLVEVRKELLLYPDIITDPHYIPVCNENGTKWKPAQCSHHEEGACFCVHEENGEILEHTKSKQLHREALSCERAVNGEHTGHECFHMQDEFNHMQESFGLEHHVPLFYYPDCTAKGSFKPLQRNDMSFFCVDTESGEVIPGTNTKAGTMPPLTEDICSAYASVWSDFKSWKKSRNIELEQTKNEEIVTEESCKPGFTFTECGCPVKCTSTSATSVKKSNNCICKPACVCPSGMLDLDGTCVTLEECNDARPPSEVPQSEKVDDLTNGLWSEYKNKNLNALMNSYNSEMMEEVMMMGGPQQVAFDYNPNVNQYFAPELPSEEGPVEGNPFGAEEIEGEEIPYLQRLLHEIGNPDPESEEYLLQQLYKEEEEQEEEIEEEEEPTGYPEEEYYEMETFPNWIDDNSMTTKYIEPTEFPMEEENGITESGNELDERMEVEEEEEEEEFQDQEIDHQTEGETEFSSVQVLSEEELKNHELTEESPCEEDCENSTEPPTEIDEENNALSEINRVLEENGFSIPFEATFEKPTQSIKKSSSG